MREILFRGKRCDNGKWVMGFYLHHRNVAHYILDVSYGGYEDIDGGFFVPRWYAVEPSSVGQYTGLKDKNGNRIFEGDILRHHNDYPDSEIKEIGVAFWDEKYCGWRRTSNGEFHHGVIDTYRLSPNCVYEIIGDIHDNPELLENP